MPAVRQPCEDARRGTLSSYGSPRDELLPPPRLMSRLRAPAPESYRRRYRTAFRPYFAGIGPSRQPEPLVANRSPHWSQNGIVGI